MSFSAIIFDHDGTLVDSEEVHFEAWQALLAEKYAVRFNRQDYINNHCGVPTLQNAESLIHTHTLAVAATQLYAEKAARVSHWLASNRFPLLPSVKESLQQCYHRGITMGLATGASSEEVQTTLNGYGLCSYFKAVVSKDDVVDSKPAADTYLLAAEKLGVEPNRCIAVEDSSTGIGSAKAAGMVCISVATAFSPNQDLSLADYHADNLQQAVEIAFALGLKPQTPS